MTRRLGPVLVAVALATFTACGDDGGTSDGDAGTTDASEGALRLLPADQNTQNTKPVTIATGSTRISTTAAVATQLRRAMLNAPTDSRRLS